MATPVSERRTYEALNGMRGVAALCVVIFHCNAVFWPAMALGGYLAVDIFFVLSGFVLAGAYGDRLSTRLLPPVRFVGLRLTRFYALYLAGLLLGVGQVLSQHIIGSPHALPASSLLLAVITAILFLPAFGLQALGGVTPLNPPAWSLIFEFWVNAAWAPLARRFGRSAEIAVLVLSGVLFIGFALKAGTVSLGTDMATIPGGLARATFSFAAGLLLYRGRGTLSPIETPWSALVLLAVVGLLFAAPSARLPSDLTVVFLLSPALVFLASRLEPPASIRPLYSFLGIISFPLYAIHQPLLGVWAFVFRALAMPPVVGGLVFFAGIIPLAWVAHHADVRIRARGSA